MTSGYSGGTIPPKLTDELWNTIFGSLPFYDNVSEATGIPTNFIILTGLIIFVVGSFVIGKLGEEGSSFGEKFGFSGGESDDSQSDSQSNEMVEAEPEEGSDDSPIQQEIIEDVGEVQKSLIAPSVIEKDTRRPKVGDEEFVQTFYVPPEAYPDAPVDGYLEKLFETTEIKYDLTIYFESQNQDRARERFKQKSNNEVAEAVQNNQAETQKHVERKQKFDDLYNEADKGTRALKISTYLTIRGEDEEELADAKDKVKEIFRNHPSDQDLTTAIGQQKKALQSTSPIGRDVLGDADPDRFKATAMAGSFGAAYASVTKPTEVNPDGIEYGWHKSTMLPLVLDPWGHDSGNAMVMVAEPGGGKSTTGKTLMQRALTQRDDVIGVTIEPMGNWAGVAKAFESTKDTPGNDEGSEHITVGGDKGINPLEIREVPRHLRKGIADDADPLGDRKEIAVSLLENFFSMRGQGDEFANHRLVCENAINDAYQAAGIRHDDLDTHSKQSPTLRDVRNNHIRDRIDNPSKYADEDWQREQIQKSAQWLYHEFEVFDVRGGGEGEEELKGAYANFGEETEFDIYGNKYVYLDLGQSEGNVSEKAKLTMQMLLDQVYEMSKQTEKKVILCMDEFRYFIRDVANIDSVENLFRHHRHQDIAPWIMTQTVHEFLQRPEAETILDMCPYFLGQRYEGLEQEDAKKLGLGPEQFTFLRDQAQPGTADRGYADALLMSGGVGREIEIHLLENELAVSEWDRNNPDWELPGVERGETTTSGSAIDTSKAKNREPVKSRGETGANSREGIREVESAFEGEYGEAQTPGWNTSGTNSDSGEEETSHAHENTSEPQFDLNQDDTTAEVDVDSDTDAGVEESEDDNIGTPKPDDTEQQGELVEESEHNIESNSPDEVDVVSESNKNENENSHEIVLDETDSVIDGNQQSSISDSNGENTVESDTDSTPDVEPTTNVDEVTSNETERRDETSGWDEAEETQWNTEYDVNEIDDENNNEETTDADGIEVAETEVSEAENTQAGEDDVDDVSEDMADSEVSLSSVVSGWVRNTFEDSGDSDEGDISKDEDEKNNSMDEIEPSDSTETDTSELAEQNGEKDVSRIDMMRSTLEGVKESLSERVDAEDILERSTNDDSQPESEVVESDDTTQTIENTTDEVADEVNDEGDESQEQVDESKSDISDDEVDDDINPHSEKPTNTTENNPDRKVDPESDAQQDSEQTVVSEEDSRNKNGDESVYIDNRVESLTTSSVNTEIDNSSTEDVFSNGDKISPDEIPSEPLSESENKREVTQPDPESISLTVDSDPIPTEPQLTQDTSGELDVKMSGEELDMGKIEDVGEISDDKQPSEPEIGNMDQKENTEVRQVKTYSQMSPTTTESVEDDVVEETQTEPAEDDVVDVEIQASSPMIPINRLSSAPSQKSLDKGSPLPAEYRSRAPPVESESESESNVSEDVSVTQPDVSPTSTKQPSTPELTTSQRENEGLSEGKHAISEDLLGIAESIERQKREQREVNDLLNIAEGLRESQEVYNDVSDKLEQGVAVAEEIKPVVIEAKLEQGVAVAEEIKPDVESVESKEETQMPVGYSRKTPEVSGDMLSIALGFRNEKSVDEIEVGEESPQENQVVDHSLKGAYLSDTQENIISKPEFSGISGEETPTKPNIDVAPTEVDQSASQSQTSTSVSNVDTPSIEIEGETEVEVEDDTDEDSFDIFEWAKETFSRSEDSDEGEKPDPVGRVKTIDEFESQKKVDESDNSLVEQIKSLVTPSGSEENVNEESDTVELEEKLWSDVEAISKPDRVIEVSKPTLENGNERNSAEPTTPDINVSENAEGSTLSVRDNERNIDTDVEKPSISDDRVSSANQGDGGREDKSESESVSAPVINPDEAKEGTFDAESLGEIVDGEAKIQGDNSEKSVRAHSESHSHGDNELDVEGNLAALLRSESYDPDEADEIEKAREPDMEGGNLKDVADEGVMPDGGVEN